MQRRPPSLATILRRALAGEAAIDAGRALLVAVSGGPDSIALLSVTARWAKRSGVRVVAHGVDHGLRPGAAAELDLAEQFAARVGVPFDRTRVTLTRGGNLQERARAARWGALAAVARAHDATIATAHHADDRAETLIMRLLRGSGLRGLAVLPPRAPAPTAEGVTVVRPLLRASRADVIAHLKREHIPFATDPSNEDPRFLRTRVRLRVLPLLRELDPRIVEHLVALADELATGPGLTRMPSWTAALPRPTQKAVADLLASGSPKARVWLPGGLAVSAAVRARRRIAPGTHRT